MNHCFMLVTCFELNFTAVYILRNSLLAKRVNYEIAAWQKGNGRNVSMNYSVKCVLV